MHLDKKIYNLNTKKEINTKIVQITDIHFSISYKTKRLKKIKEKIDEINPKYVCIVGDIIDEYDVVEKNEIEILKEWLRQLSKKYKIIISLGNHEFIARNKTKYNNHINIDWLLNLKSDNIIILNNDTYIDNNINFIGYNPDYMYYYCNNTCDIEKYNKEISNLITKNNYYNILLLHTPTIITRDDNYKRIRNIKNIDLILSGHTHGGIIPSFIPGNFGIISPSKKLFPKKIRGIINYETFNLIISSGIVKLSRKSKLEKFNDIFGYNINIINIKKI